MSINHQIDMWSDQFGKEYTERNTMTLEEVDSLALETFGVTRTNINNQFLANLNIYDKRVLEVGCNVGLQLKLLQKQGFKSLYGVELQHYAIEKAKEITKEINFVQGLANDLPFKDNYFEMVFTCGVLIHISPDTIESVMDEMYRCSNKYIWGFEYFAEKYTEVKYRGNDSLLWKANFAELFLKRFDNLVLVKEEHYKYSDSENVDSMYLLMKK